MQLTFLEPIGYKPTCLRTLLWSNI